MARKIFVKMWAEENENYYDLLPIVRNYGPKMVWGIPAKSAVAYAKDFHAEFYLDEGELGYFADQGYVFYVEQDGLGRLMARLDEDIPKMQAAVRHLASLDLSTLDHGRLFEEYLKHARPYGGLMASYIITQPHFISRIEQELKTKLAVYHDHESIFAALCAPRVKFSFSEKGEFFQKSFAELIGEEDAKPDISRLAMPLYEEKPADVSPRSKLIATHDLKPDTVRLGEILGKVAELRLKMRFVWMPAKYSHEAFLVELKRRHGIPKAEIRRYDTDEFEELIRIGQAVDRSILTVRAKGFAKVLANGRIRTLSGDEATSFVGRINQGVKVGSEIKGTVASRGFARGRVIVLSYAQSSSHTEKIRRMRKGDILVSEMTRPNIIVACEKAGAIVTDEGGITCHAAIVSRELNKPCIIGTKNATRVLKDGDLVEVDAEAGVVRIVAI